jgi:hypothetical protein
MAKHVPKSVVYQAKDQYPIHRGPFLFAPHFLTPPEWFPNFSRLIEKALLAVKAKATIVKPTDSNGRCVRIEFSNAEMTIDGDAGIFFVDKLGTSKLDFDEMPFPDWSGPCGVPRQYFRELSQPDYIARLDHDHKNVCKFSSLLYRWMKHRFAKAQAQGIARLTARVGRPFAKPTIIDAWQLQHLRLVEKEREKYFEDDRDLDDAIGSDGTKIFGLGVTPVIRSLGAEPAEPEAVMKPRGRRPSIDHAKLHVLIVGLIRKRGIPGRKNPRWTGELLVKAVKSQMQVGRTAILKTLPSVIAEYKKELGRNDLR